MNVLLRPNNIREDLLSISYDCRGGIVTCGFDAQNQHSKTPMTPVAFGSEPISIQLQLPVSKPEPATECHRRLHSQTCGDLPRSRTRAEFRGERGHQRLFPCYF